MTLDTILTALKAERDKLTKAIAALEGTTATAPAIAPPATPAPAGPTAAPATAVGKRRRRWKMSAEARRQISEAKKEWWAKQKRKAK